MACVTKQGNSPYWFLDYRRRGDNRRMILKTDPPTTSKKIATEQLHAVLASMGPKRAYGPVTVGQVMERYQNYLKANCQSSATARKSWINWWTSHYGKWKAADFAGAEIDHAINVLNTRHLDKDGKVIGKKLAEGTIGNYLELLRSAFRHAVAEGILLSHPIVMYRIGHQSPLREVVFTEAEEPRIKKYVSPRVADLFDWMIATGQRLGDAIRMGRDNVNEDDWTLTWTQEKTRRRVRRTTTVPLSPAAIDLLTRFPKEGLFFAGRDQSRPCNKLNVQLRLKLAMRKAGVKGKTIHDCRRTFAQRLHLAGVPDATISFLLGHGSLKTIENYRWTEKEIKIKMARQYLELPPANVVKMRLGATG